MKNIFKFMGVALIAGSMLFVACGKDDPEENNTNTEETTYTVTATTNDADMGTVTISPVKDKYSNGDTVILTATAKEGYTFVNWNDQNADNPRTVIVTKNINFMANFAEKPFEGTEVKIDGTAWATCQVGAGTAQGEFITIFFEQYGNDNAQTIYLVGGTTVGTFSDEDVDAQGYSLYYWFYNHSKEQFTYNNRQIPVWQTVSMEQTITAIDMTAHTYAFTATGMVYNAELYDQTDPTSVHTKDIDIQVNTTWTQLNFQK